MSGDDIKSHVAQTIAWLTVLLGGISLELWIAFAGLMISAFISWTNYRSRRFQDQLLKEQAAREREWHEMEKERLALLRRLPSIAPYEEALRATPPPDGLP